MAASLCTARASYKKIGGLLRLTDSHLEWTQDGKSAPSVVVPNSDATSLFCSKDGAPQVRLKLGLIGDEVGHNFTFTAPLSVAYSERESFKSRLTSIISRNRSMQDSASPVTPTSALTPASVPVPSLVVSSDCRTTPVTSGNDPHADYRLRVKVLLANPDLSALHRELVMTGQISEDDFWDGREHLLLTESAVENQKRGKPGQLVDPRPEAVQGGDIRIKITPQLVHDIFDEYPVVAKAYSENVPEKLTEEGFWKRYFQSRLFHAHRASIRSSAVQHVVKDDPIFDKYLEADDDGFEPRRQRDDPINVFVDLLATQEDHDMTGNEKDVTMQPGRQKGVLPLIRKFNEHSERILNSALGDTPVKRQRLESAQDLYSSIDLEDLRDQEPSLGIALEMQDSQRYFEGGMSQDASNAIKKLDIPATIREVRTGVEDWRTKLMQLKLQRKPADDALSSMTQNVTARLDTRSRRTNAIPDGLLSQIITCQAAANEFLRQFWSALHPPADHPTVLVASPARQTAKAMKMIEYLSTTREKVDALVAIARQHGIDPLQVEMVLQPTLNAVDHALKFRGEKITR